MSANSLLCATYSARAHQHTHVYMCVLKRYRQGHYKSPYVPHIFCWSIDIITTAPYRIYSGQTTTVNVHTFVLIHKLMSVYSPSTMHDTVAEQLLLLPPFTEFTYPYHSSSNTIARQHYKQPQSAFNIERRGIWRSHFIAGH